MLLEKGRTLPSDTTLQHLVHRLYKRSKVCNSIIFYNPLPCWYNWSIFSVQHSVLNLSTLTLLRHQLPQRSGFDSFIWRELPSLRMQLPNFRGSRASSDALVSSQVLYFRHRPPDPQNIAILKGESAILSQDAGAQLTTLRKAKSGANT